MLSRACRRLSCLQRTDVLGAVLLLVVILPVLCITLNFYHSVYYRTWSLLRHSALFRVGVLGEDTRLLAQTIAENDERTHSARMVLENIQAVTSVFGQEQGADCTSGDVTEIQIAIVIISSKRDMVFENQVQYQPWYLAQNIARFYDLLEVRHLTKGHKARFSLRICATADGDLTDEEQFLGQLVTLVRVPRVETTFGPFHDILAWPYEKEKRDYLSCMQHGLDTGAAYVLVVEDDAIARVEALDVVEQFILRRHSEENKYGGSVRQVRDDGDVTVPETQPRQAGDDIGSEIQRRPGARSLSSAAESSAAEHQSESERLHNIDVLSSNARRTDAVDGQLVSANATRNLAIQTSNFKHDNLLSVTSSDDPSDRTGCRKKVIRSHERFYAKLYHPKRLQGYVSIEYERLPQLLATSVLLGTILYVLCEKLLSRTGFSLTNCIQGIGNFRVGYWAACCVLGCVVCLCVGRPHVDAWRRWFSPHLHYAVPDVHCCTQAILYTPAAAQDLINSMSGIRCNESFHKDDAFWKWATGRVQRAEGHPNDEGHPSAEGHGKGDKVRGWLIQPNLFEHIGIASSLRNGFVDPQMMLD